jgi:S1-C subfamily serine protease
MERRDRGQRAPAALDGLVRFASPAISATPLATIFATVLAVVSMVSSNVASAGDATALTTASVVSESAPMGAPAASPPSSLPRSSSPSAQADTISLAGLEAQFQALSKRLASSVVAISATSTAVPSTDLARAERISADSLNATVFDKASRIVGTGFVIASDGYLLTNDHVVAEAQQLWVTTDDRRVYPAIVVASDPRTDLAVLKIPAAHLQPVKFATTDARRGQWSIALGNPFGLSSEGEICMSVGIVSGTNRSLSKLASNEGRLYSNLIQTTAEINPGNSGGPLFNLAGEVIGINTAVVLPYRQANGIGFAIPADRDVLRIVDDLRNGREVVHGYLGVTVSRPTPAQRATAAMTTDLGARVDRVEVDSPAAIAGLKVGDIVESIDGKAVRDGDHLVRQVALADISQPVSITVRRGAVSESLSARLSPRSQVATATEPKAGRMWWGGLLVGPVPGHWMPGGGATGVMVLAVNRAAGVTTPTGVSAGTVITAVAGRPVASLVDLQRIVNDTPAEKCSVTVLELKDAVTSAGQQ